MSQALQAALQSTICYLFLNSICFNNLVFFLVQSSKKYIFFVLLGVFSELLMSFIVIVINLNLFMKFCQLGCLVAKLLLSKTMLFLGEICKPETSLVLNKWHLECLAPQWHELHSTGTVPVQHWHCTYTAIALYLHSTGTVPAHNWHCTCTLPLHHCHIIITCRITVHP